MYLTIADDAHETFGSLITNAHIFSTVNIDL